MECHWPGTSKWSSQVYNRVCVLSMRHGFSFLQVGLFQRVKREWGLPKLRIHSCLKWLLVSWFFHFFLFLQNWAGMRCPYKLLRMILALVCSKLSSLTWQPVSLVISLLLTRGGGLIVGLLSTVSHTTVGPTEVRVAFKNALSNWLVVLLQLRCSISRCAPLFWVVLLILFLHTRADAVWLSLVSNMFPPSVLGLLPLS